MGLSTGKYLSLSVLFLACAGFGVLAADGVTPVPESPAEVSGNGASGSVGGVATRKVEKSDPDKLYYTAKKQELAGQYEQAKSVYRMAVHNGATGMAMEQAYLGLARCEYQLGNFWQAFKAVESSYPTTFLQKEVRLRAVMEMDLAARLRGLKGEPVSGSASADGKEINGYQAAAKVYDRIVYNDPKGKFAREALRLRAECLKEAGDLEGAENSLRLLVNTFPQSDEASLAQPDLVEVLAKRSQDEQGGLKGDKQVEALDRLRQAKTVNSTDPQYSQRLAKADNALKEGEAAYKMVQVKSYMRRGDSSSEDAARFLLKDILKRYPETSVAAEAEKLLSDIGGGNGEGK